MRVFLFLAAVASVSKTQGFSPPRLFPSLSLPLSAGSLARQPHPHVDRLLVGLTTTCLPTTEDGVSRGAYNGLDTTSLKNFWHQARRNSVWHWRFVFGSFFGSLFLFRNAIDLKLVGFWKYLLTSQALPARVFRTDSWEWCWAISCFAVYIHAFGLVDKLVGKADREGRVHPWKKYRLQDRYEADRFHRKMERLGRSDDGQKAKVVETEPPMPVVQQSEWHWQAWLVEFWVYAAPLLTWDILAPRRHRRIGGFGPPTTMGILGGIVGALLMYDFLFFCGHYLMHKIPFLYRFVHAKHHKVKEVRACEIVRLSVGEEVLEVGFSIIALNYLGVHPVARTIYNAVITFLLTELHCGFDFPWQPQSVVPFGLATGSRRHHYHHRFGRHYYQKFFFTLDRLFRFFQKDDGTLEGDSVKADAYVPPSWGSFQPA